MYLKFDLSVYKMTYMWCWLPSNSLTSVIYSDFEVHGAISLSISVHAQSIGTQKSLVIKFWDGNREKVKKVSVLGEKTFLWKTTCILFLPSIIVLVILISWFWSGSILILPRSASIVVFISYRISYLSCTVQRISWTSCIVSIVYPIHCNPS